jgi:hypothetical protein
MVAELLNLLRSVPHHGTCAFCGKLIPGSTYAKHLANVHQLTSELIEAALGCEE